MDGCTWKGKPLEVEQNYSRMRTIHGIKDTGMVVKVSFTSKRMYKYT